MAGFQPPNAPVGPGPFVHGVAIVTSDTVPLPFITRGIYVGGAGDVTLVLAGDTTVVTFKAVPQGTMLPVCTQLVHATLTTATLMTALA